MLVMIDFITAWLLRLAVIDLIIVSAATLIFHEVLKILRIWKGPAPLPPGPWSLPFVGYLPFLGDDVVKKFGDLATVYGSVFGLTLGSRYVVVINDRDSMMEAFQNKDINGRPEKSFFISDHLKHLAQENNDSWVEHRKYIENHFKHFTRSNRDHGLSKLIEDKLEGVLEELENIGHAQNVNIHRLFAKEIRNIMTESLWGEPFNPKGSIKREEMEEYEHYVMQQATVKPALNLLYFPTLDPILRTLSPYFRRNFNVGQRYENFIKKKIINHRKVYNPDEESDFIDRYLTYLEGNKENTIFSENTLNGSIQLLAMAGSDTVTASLEFLFLILAAHSHVQEKVYQEILGLFGTEVRATWTDRHKMPYTLAVIHEGQRYRLIVPINTVRISLKDTKVKGYHIPKGTTIFVNQWLIHNELSHWVDPEKFIPERYLNDEGNFNSKQYMHTFSTGRRNCPGKEQALIEIFTFTTSIVQRFKVLPSDKGVSLEAKTGLVLGAVHPVARFQKR